MVEMKTWPKPWQSSLAQKLTQLSKADGSPIRIALVGIGNELRGDDAAGIAVIRGLSESFSPFALENVLLVEAAHAPENHTGPIRKFEPDLVILIDMAQMDEEPGAVRWISWQETTGISASTHTMPPYMLGEYLTAVTQTEVALIGLQPAHTDLDMAMSAEMETAVYEVIRTLASILKNHL